MNTDQIITALQKIKQFIGVFPADLLPNINKYKKPVCFIANYDSSNKKGSHWVSFFINKDNIEYFDSFGILPYNKYFINFINKFCKNSKFQYNNIQLQSEHTNVCGHYAILYIYQRLRKLKPSQIIKQFHFKKKKLINNDISVYKIINNLFTINKKTLKKNQIASDV